MDVVTPLVHDFFYENLLLDYQAQNFSKIELKGKVYRITDEDEIYRKYAYSFIQEAKEAIASDFQHMRQTNETARYKERQRKDLNVEKLKEVFGDIDDYNKLVKLYACHIGLTNWILEMVQRDRLKELVDFEYTMITGIGEVGQKVTKEQKIEMLKKNWD